MLPLLNERCYCSVRVTFHEKEGVEKALKLDRELRINGFLVTVSKYRDEEEQKAHSANVSTLCLLLLFS